MKNWQVIKAIAENPELTFKNKRFGGVLGYLGDGTLGWVGGTDNIGEPFTIHYRAGEEHNGNWDDDWELAREPVDFMTAVNSGKRIKHAAWLDFYPLMDALDILQRNYNSVAALERINGKWIVE